MKGKSSKLPSGLLKIQIKTKQSLKIGIYNSISTSLFMRLMTILHLNVEKVTATIFPPAAGWRLVHVLVPDMKGFRLATYTTPDSSTFSKWDDDPSETGPAPLASFELPASHPGFRMFLLCLLNSF